MEHDMLDQIRREILNDPYYQQNFSNDGERFVAWYLRRVLLRDAIATRDDITDGQNDKQMDAVIVDDEDRVEFELLTTGTLTDAARSDLKVFSEKLEDFDEFAASLQLVDAEVLE